MVEKEVVRLLFGWTSWTFSQLCLAAKWYTAGIFAIDKINKISYHEFCDNSLHADGHIIIFLHLARSIDFGWV